jgi:hypothetical protein
LELGGPIVDEGQPVGLTGIGQVWPLTVVGMIAGGRRSHRIESEEIAQERADTLSEHSHHLLRGIAGV